MISRREWIVSAAIATRLQVARLEAARPAGTLIESHLHLFAGDPEHFPYSSAAYTPKPNPVEQYVAFASEAKLDHAVIVHPEPYQDDHRYLEYCFAHEPFRGFFKGTCLFDPIDPATPAKLRALVRRNPDRIVALRIHEVHAAGTPSTRTGAIRDRDLQDPRMAITWRAAHELGLAIQMHTIPNYAPLIGKLAAQFPAMPVILDHLDRPGQGTAAEYEHVLALARLRRVYMKFSSTGVASASKEPFPHADAKPLVKRVYQAFGANRILWGELGNNMAELDRAIQLFNTLLDFIPESERIQIRGGTAKALFGFA